MKRKIYVDDGFKRNIGIYDYTYKIFTKEVVKSKHLMRVINSWGLDSRFFNKTLLPNDALIKVFDVEENKTYKVKAKKFAEKGQYYHFKNQGNTDHRTQIFLPLEHWDITDHNSPEEKEKELIKIIYG